MASLSDMIYISRDAFEKNFPVDSSKTKVLYKLAKDEPKYDQEAIYAKLISKLKYPTDKVYIKFKNINELKFEGMMAAKSKVNSKYQNGIYMSSNLNKVGFYFTIEAYINLRHILKINIDQDVEFPKSFDRSLLIDYSKIPAATTNFRKATSEPSEDPEPEPKPKKSSKQAQADEEEEPSEEPKPVETKSKKEKEKKSKKTVEPPADEEEEPPEEPKPKKEKEKKSKKTEAPAEEPKDNIIEPKDNPDEEYPPF